MSADFTPEKEDYKILTPFKMQVLTNFPYIEADFDALTNYELLCKIVEYLNAVIHNENEITEQVTGLYNAYVSLQNYVNNYFDNLDIQEEINNKLDAMVEDGTFANILEGYIDVYVPRNITDKVVSTIGNGGFVEKSNTINNITYSTNEYTIRDSKANNLIDLSTATHGIVENLHLTNANAGILINKDSGWNGSNKFRAIFTYGCKYPFKLACNDVTDTSLSYSTFENWRKCIEVNNKIHITNIYIGDNGLEVDAEEPDVAIVANSNAEIHIENSDIGCSVRVGGSNNPVIRFNTTSDHPASVYLKDTNIGSGNQNVDGRGYGGIADLSNANDRLYIDNCTFKRSTLNDNHNVAPYLLKDYQTVWSLNPFYSYLIGGDLYSIKRLSPKNTTLSLVDTSKKNPFGGNIIHYTQYSFNCYYHIPDSLVGKTMYLHVYCYKLNSVSSPSINYDSSDCTETGKSANFKTGYHGTDTPFLNIIPITPTKNKGKINVYGQGANAYVELAGIFLVEEQYKNMLCCYKEYSNITLCHDTPTSTGAYGDIVYSTDPQTTSCDGWRYTTEWTSFTL